MLNLLAFDYGASSGRAILGSFNGHKLELDEVHRFSNDPVKIGDSFYWDVLRLYFEMKQGMVKCVKSGKGKVAGIGIDTWGVDFGLLDSMGELMGNPRHYRDSRTEGMIEIAAREVPKTKIYEQTGIAFQKFNTIYQLLSMKLNNSAMLEKASTMLFIPDLLNYFLTGAKASEFTVASTSQMLDARTHKWSTPLLRKLGIPDRILTDIVRPGTKIGSVLSSIRADTGFGDVPVIAVAEHDTGSAVVSVPAAESGFAYLSSGTWSLLGVESETPVINDNTYRLNYTNEGGFNNTTRLLKNIMGLWIYQECKRTWDRQGEVLSFEELEEAAERSEPFRSFIDPDNNTFYSPGNMPDKVREFCIRTGQDIPRDKASVVRCVMESLAMKYRKVLKELEGIIGVGIPVLHIIGGGSKNVMLCRFTANAIDRPVIVGPVEATAIGNLICQLIALGEVKDLKEARTIVANSFPTLEYMPDEVSRWDDAYERFKEIEGL